MSESDVVGGFSLSREGSFYTPQAVAVVEDGRVNLHTLSTPFHYYLVPGATGVAGFALFGLLGILGGVIVGTVVAFYLQRRKYSRGMRRIREGDRGTPEIVVKKGKVSSVDVDEGRLGKTLHVATPSHDFSLEGTDEDIEAVRDVLI